MGITLKSYKFLLTLSVCYAQNRDAKPRNEVCDKTMLGELKDIDNPRGREKVDKALIQKIIGTKVRFGWGLTKTQGGRMR